MGLSISMDARMYERNPLWSLTTCSLTRVPCNCCFSDKDRQFCVVGDVAAPRYQIFHRGSVSDGR